jgi:hypothetical protein
MGHRFSILKDLPFIETLCSDVPCSGSCLLISDQKHASSVVLKNHARWFVSAISCCVNFAACALLVQAINPASQNDRATIGCFFEVKSIKHPPIASSPPDTCLRVSPPHWAYLESQKWIPLLGTSGERWLCPVQVAIWRVCRL